MRLLHTADWHVGKTLAGRSRAREHEAVLAEIAAAAREKKVDLVTVAGDLFDSAAPSADAERIVYGALLALSEVAPVVVIPGNHDNERRLAAVSPIFARTGVTVHAFLSGDACIEHTTPGGEKVRLALLPWLSQRYVVRADELMSQEAYQNTGTYAERMRRIIAKLADGFADDAVNLIVGHVTVANAQLGGGERTAQTIFDYWIDGTAFPAGAHAVLLGHVHRMQAMPGPCPIHYCGSPLHLDFSDDEGPKGVLVVDAEPGKPAQIEAVHLTSGRKLRTIEGSLEQLRTLAGSTGDDYLRVKVHEGARVGLADEVRDLFPEAVKVLIEAPTLEDEDRRAPIDPAASPHDLFVRYLDEHAIEDPALVALFDDLYEELHATNQA